LNIKESEIGVDEELGLKDKIQNLFEHQIQQEYNNFLIYVKISGYLNKMRLNGLAEYFNKNGTEEVGHGNLLASFMRDQGYTYSICDCNTICDKIEDDMNDYSLYDLVKLSLNREKTNTDNIYYILDFCISNKLGIEEQFTRSFLAEQIEEVEKFQTLLDKLYIAKNEPSAILMIDKEYGEK